MKTAAILVASSVLTLAAAPAELYRFGRLGERLPADDLTAVRAAVGDQGTPWALVGWYSQVLPEVRYVDLFLAPTVSGSRLRRGAVAHLKCSPDGNRPSCLNWAPATGAGAYAQVAAGPDDFGEGFALRSPVERPFRVHGQFSDADLVSLVSYVRTNPAPRLRGGSIGMSISGAMPISDVYRESDGSVTVLLTENGYVGQSARCVRTRKGWRVVEVTGGVS